MYTHRAKRPWTFEAQGNPTPRSQLSLRLSLSNWTFGFYWMRYFGKPLVGLDLGPIEITLQWHA